MKIDIEVSQGTRSAKPNYKILLELMSEDVQVDKVVG